MEGRCKVVLANTNLLFSSDVAVVYLGHHGGDLIGRNGGTVQGSSGKYKPFILL
jgi:hypothetical protein